MPRTAWPPLFAQVRPVGLGDEPEDEEVVGDARLTSAWTEGEGVLSKSVEVAGRTEAAEEEESVENAADVAEAAEFEDEDDSGTVEDEATDVGGDVDDSTDETADIADITEDADGEASVEEDVLPAEATESVMLDAETGGAVIVINCVLTTVAVDTTIDTLTASVAFVTEDEDAGTDADIANVELEATDEEELAVPEVVVPPPDPDPDVPVATGAGVPTIAMGSPLGALGVAVGCTPAKFATGTVPFTTGVGSPPGYESSKMSCCAPSRKL